MHDDPGEKLRTPVRILLFYHRDTRNKYHGEAVYVRQFILESRDRFSLVTIAPGAGALTPARFSPLGEDILSSLRYQLGALFRSRKLLPPDRRALVIVADVYLFVIPLLIAKIRRIPLVFLCSDLPGRYAASFAQSTGSGSLSVRLVRGLLDWLTFRTSDVIVVRTEAMQTAIASLLAPRSSKVPVLVAHHLAVRTPFEEAHLRTQLREWGIEDSLLLVFTGDCFYPPNAQAGRYILDQVAPTLEKLFPKVVVLLAGPGSDRLGGGARPNVKVLGMVDDLSLLLYAAHVGIAPIPVEGGVSSKVIDYLAHGLTVVATPQAAVGQPPSERLLVSPIDDFPEALHRLLRMDAHPRGFEALTKEGKIHEVHSEPVEESWRGTMGTLAQLARRPGGRQEI